MKLTGEEKEGNKRKEERKINQSYEVISYFLFADVEMRLREIKSLA